MKQPKLPKNTAKHFKAINKNDSNKDDEKSINVTALILKISDEIIRIANNLYHMDEDIKGKKQIEKSLERIKDTFVVNHIEIKEMLRLPYNEGMNVKVQNWIENDKITEGEQMITRVIKPQVNILGKIYQNAEVEVTIGTKK
jgi:hypothetical protein